VDSLRSVKSSDAILAIASEGSILSSGSV